ncbi:MAG: M20/M25/M40 family metallo-hydrolase [Hamadaea sp.]|nr:M20/M25/M40 family metallo-hydrolase [Hamadaea sp.]
MPLGGRRGAAVAGADLRNTVDNLMARARTDLAELVAIPSIAQPGPSPLDDHRRAAEWVRAAFAAEGFADARLLDTPDGVPAVYGSLPCSNPDAPTVLLYAHYDVQPPGDRRAWRTPPFELTTGPDGRWLGRGAADCKGAVVMHLTALRALGGDVPVHVKVIVEGSGERGSGGLATMLPEYAGLLAADVVLVADAGNLAVGVPALTLTARGLVTLVVTVQTLQAPAHSGRFGGPAPDALTALIRMLATFHDDFGNTSVMGLDNIQSWAGALYPPARFREEAGVLDGVTLPGTGEIADLVWARPSLTVLGIDCPPVAASEHLIHPVARARLALRVPPNTDCDRARRALVEHLHAVVPWGVRVRIDQEDAVEPFRAKTDGPAHTAMTAAMRAVYGEEPASLGRGGSSPLLAALGTSLPGAELLLLGVAEPHALVHAPNESVDPQEIADMALVETLFLRTYAARR